MRGSFTQLDDATLPLGDLIIGEPQETTIVTFFAGKPKPRQLSSILVAQICACAARMLDVVGRHNRSRRIIYVAFICYSWRRVSRFG